MARHYFRVQESGLTIEQMQTHISADGGDGMDMLGGICACDSVASLLNNTAMDAANDDDEVIIFEGRKICEIYDGYRVEPVREIARFTVQEFVNMCDEMTAFEKW